MWFYSLSVSMVDFLSNALMDVFNMDMEYFKTAVPIIDELFGIVIAVGWALLIGNLAFQALKTMASGMGFEGEDPKILFCRTFVFGFLLIASPQICDIGLGISKTIITLLQVPSSVEIPTIDETSFTFDASWVFVIIVGTVMMFQVIKFFFQVGERYVITAMLTVLAPFAFSMGGSKNTEDIFKGWCRMFASMCVMMIVNVIFLKILLSAITTVPSGIAVIPWLVLVVAIGRVARKIDDIIGRIGLSTARTGEPLGLGRGMPGMLTMMVARNLAGTVSKTVAKNKPSASSSKSGRNTSSAGTQSMGNTAKAQGFSHTQSERAGKQGDVNATSQSTHQSATSSAGTAVNAMQGAASMAGTVVSSNTAESKQQTTAPNYQGNSSPQEKQGGGFAYASFEKAEGAQTRPVSNMAKNTPVRPPIGRAAYTRDNTTQSNTNAGTTSIGRNSSGEQATVNANNRPETQSIGISHSRKSATPTGDIASQSVNEANFTTQATSHGRNVMSPQTTANTNNRPDMQNVSTSHGRNQSLQPSGARIASGGSPASTGDIASQSVKEVNSTARITSVGRNSSVEQTTVNANNRPNMQNIGTSHGRKSAMPTGDITSQSVREANSNSTSGARNTGGSPQNSPEIYTRQSKADIPPLQNTPAKPKSGARDTTNASPAPKRPPLGRNRGEKK